MKRMVVRSILIIGFTAISLIAVFMSQWYVLTALGAGVKTDALFAGLVVPQLILNVVSGSLGFVLVPLLSTVDKASFRQAFFNYLVLLCLFFGALAILLWAGSAYWVPWTVPGFDVESQRLTIELARIQLLGMFFTGVGAVFTAAYQAQGKFVRVAVSSAVAACSSLAGIALLLPDYEIHGAAWMMSLRPLIQLVLLLGVLFPLGRCDLRQPELRESIGRLGALMAGSIYYKTDQLIDRLLLSMGAGGMISILHMAQQLYGAASQIVVSAFSGPVVPALSRCAAKGDWAGFRRSYRHTLIINIVIGVVSSILIFLLGRFFLELLFTYKSFTAESVDQLWSVMLFLSGYWITGLTGQVLSTSFYAMRDTRRPTMIGSLGYTLGVPMKIAGFYFYGIYGLALATSLYMFVNSLLMYFVLEKILDKRMLGVNGVPS